MKGIILPKAIFYVENSYVKPGISKGPVRCHMNTPESIGSRRKSLGRTNIMCYKAFPMVFLSLLTNFAATSVMTRRSTIARV